MTCASLITGNGPATPVGGDGHARKTPFSNENGTAVRLYDLLDTLVAMRMDVGHNTPDGLAAQ
jgi:hypothetical protein